MNAGTVYRKETPSHVLSVRLSSKELKRLTATLGNYQIQGSCLSEQLRAFFQVSYIRSIRYASKNR